MSTNQNGKYAIPIQTADHNVLPKKFHHDLGSILNWAAYGGNASSYLNFDQTVQLLTKYLDIKLDNGTITVEFTIRGQLNQVKIMENFNV